MVSLRGRKAWWALGASALLVAGAAWWFWGLFVGRGDGASQPRSSLSWNEVLAILEQRPVEVVLGALVLVGLGSALWVWTWRSAKKLGRNERRDLGLEPAGERASPQAGTSALEVDASWQALQVALQDLDHKVQILLERRLAERAPDVAQQELQVVVPPRLEVGEAAAERALLAVANRWWSLGGSDPGILASLRTESGVELELMTLEDLDRTFRQPTGQSYRFRTSSGPAEWLSWRDPAAGGLLIVPLAARYFQVGYSIQVVKNLFQGIDAVPERFRFRRVDRACRLQPVPGEPATYRAQVRGEIDLGPVQEPSPREERAAPVPDLAGPGERGVELEAALLSRLQQTVEQGQRRTEATLLAWQKRFAALEEGVSAVAELARAWPRLENQLAELREQFGRLASPAAHLAVQSRIESRMEAPAEPRNQGGETTSASSEPQTRPEAKAPAPAVPPGPAKSELLAAVVDGIAGLPGGGPRAGETPSGRGGEQYLEALLSDQASLDRALSLRGFEVWIAHLTLASETISGEPLVRFEPVKVDSSATSVRTSTGTLVGPFLFQCGLLVTAGESSSAAFLVARGALPDRYRPGLAPLLTGAVFEGGRRVVRVLSPALLRRVDQGSNAYLVEKRLEVELEPVPHSSPPPGR